MSDLQHLCLDNIFQSQWSAMLTISRLSIGSPSSPIVSYLYMGQFENLALSTYEYTGLQSCHRYVGDTFVVFYLLTLFGLIDDY